MQFKLLWKVWRLTLSDTAPDKTETVMDDEAYSPHYAALQAGCQPMNNTIEQCLAPSESEPRA